MSAAEIIEQIKLLSPEERAQVVAFIEGLQVGPAAEFPADGVAESAVRYIPETEVEARAAKLFADHHELFRRLAQ